LKILYLLFIYYFSLLEVLKQKIVPRETLWHTPLNKDGMCLCFSNNCSLPSLSFLFEIHFLDCAYFSSCLHEFVGIETNMLWMHLFRLPLTWAGWNASTHRKRLNMDSLIELSGRHALKLTLLDRMQEQALVKNTFVIHITE